MKLQKIIACAFNTDTACVEVKYSDGTRLNILLFEKHYSHSIKTIMWLEGLKYYPELYLKSAIRQLFLRKSSG